DAPQWSVGPVGGDIAGGSPQQRDIGQLDLLAVDRDGQPVPVAPEVAVDRADVSQRGGEGDRAAEGELRGTVAGNDGRVVDRAGHAHEYRCPDSPVDPDVVAVTGGRHHEDERHLMVARLRRRRHLDPYGDVLPGPGGEVELGRGCGQPGAGRIR